MPFCVISERQNDRFLHCSTYHSTWSLYLGTFE